MDEDDVEDLGLPFKKKKSFINKRVLLLVVLPLSILIGVYLNAIYGPDSSSDGNEIVNGVKLGSGEMFNEIAPNYDLMNRMMSLGMDQTWRGEMISALDLKADDQILDLATGTADVAIAMGEHLRTKEGFGEQKKPNKIQITGVDPSQGMLSIGRKKINSKSKQMSSFIQLNEGDAQNLVDYDENSFDKITMSFGIRNVPNRNKALHEIYRVLKKNPPYHTTSKVAIMEFALPQTGPLAPFARFMINHGAPAIGAIFTGKTSEYVHLKDSINEFPSPKYFARQMQKAGLEVYDMKSLAFGTVVIYLAKPIVNINTGQNSEGNDDEDPFSKEERKRAERQQRKKEERRQRRKEREAEEL